MNYYYQQKVTDKSLAGHPLTPQVLSDVTSLSKSPHEPLIKGEVECLPTFRTTYVVLSPGTDSKFQPYTYSVVHLKRRINIENV